MSNSEQLTVLFQGASGSGKSQLISWHMTGRGQEACKTLEENYEYCEQFQGRKEQVNFLDTSGDAECAEMMEEWVSKANSQILLINLEDPQSVGYLQAIGPALSTKEVRARVLVGNLPSGKEENRVVGRAECAKLATSLFPVAVRYVEVNTRTGAGVPAVFHVLMESAHRKHVSGAEQEKPDRTSESKAITVHAAEQNADKEEIRFLKAQQAILEAKLAAMTARFEALEAKLQAEEKAASTRFETIEAKVSDTSLTHKIEELLLNQLKKIGWGRGASPPKNAESDTPSKGSKVKVTGRGHSIRQGLFSSSSSVP